MNQLISQFIKEKKICRNWLFKEFNSSGLTYRGVEQHTQCLTIQKGVPVVIGWLNG